MKISNALADLGMLPIQDIPQLPKSPQEVLTVAGLLLECLWEMQASVAGPWDYAQAGRHAHCPGYLLRYLLLLFSCV
jgi:hypothetical protein